MRGELDALQQRIHDLEAANVRLERRAQLDHDRLGALMQITTAFVITRDVDAMLRLTMRYAAELIPGVARACLWLLDGDSEHLLLYDEAGGRAPFLRLQPGQGVAGRVAIAPRPMRFVGADLEAALRDHARDDLRELETLLGADWPPLSAIGAPLRTEYELLGALVLWGKLTDELQPGELLFVQALTNLLSNVLAEIRQTTRVTQLGAALETSRQTAIAAQQQLDATQAGLLQTAKLAAVGQLAASVAHEINNPLYAVRSSLYLVEQDLPPNAPQREFLDLAQQELGRIARIIARMRDFYKPVRSEFQPTDLNDLLRETLHLAATYLDHSAVAVDQHLDPALPPVFGSADQLRQVLLNLILNACDAMPDGGTLTVRTAVEREQVVVTIGDTGVGIPPDVRERLFEPFFTTKPTGTGLGLSVSYHIVTQHDGSFDISSAAGKGTVCTIRLPLITTSQHV